VTQNGITGSFNATTGRADAVGLGDGRELPGGAALGDLRQRSTNPSTATRTVSVVANDGTANSNTATRTITVGAVNDAPVVTMTARRWRSPRGMARRPSTPA
jgi:hypothetical protein